MSLPAISARDRDKSPARGKDSGALSQTHGDLRLSYTPRRAVLRARVLTSRSPAGGYTIMPSWNDPHLGQSQASTEAPTSSQGQSQSLAQSQFQSKSLAQSQLQSKSLHSRFAGSDSSQAASTLKGPEIPVQAVMPKPPNMFARPKVDNVSGKVLLAANILGAKGRSSRFGAVWRPEMTNENLGDLKVRLNNLAQFCRGGDVPRNPRRLDNFLRELGGLCEFMEIGVVDKSFRSRFDFTNLQSFLRAVPDLQEAGAGMSELPNSGFLAFTILLVLTDVAWEFRYNSITHKICDCQKQFGAQHCLVPIDTDVIRSRAAEDARNEIFKDQKKAARIEELQRTERHFNPKLQELSTAVKERFLDLGKQIPKKLEEFLSMAIPPSTLMWERFVINFTSHITVFDQYYTRFEVMYLSLVDKMLSSAMAPLHSMTEHSTNLVLEPSDSFRPMQTSMFCQRLGLLKRQVDFGGIGLTEFNPTLLAKAKRVLVIDTFKEVQDMAHQMIDRFEGLCRQLEEVKDHNLRPELSENLVLRESVTDLEKIWDRCQYVLAQKALDFMNELIKYVEDRLDIWMRWKIKVAVMRDSNQSEQDDRDARNALFVTLPILMYLDEMRKDCKAELAGGDPYYSNFRDLFCPDDDRYHRLRSEIGKFDERRFMTLYNFVLESGGAGSVNEQMKYFLNVYRQLKEAAAFDLTIDPSKLSAREEYARAQWICMHEIVQKVKPDLFPKEAPPKPQTEAEPSARDGEDASDMPKGAARRTSGPAARRASGLKTGGETEQSTGSKTVGRRSMAARSSSKGEVNANGKVNANEGEAATSEKKPAT